MKKKLFLTIILCTFISGFFFSAEKNKCTVTVLEGKAFLTDEKNSKMKGLSVGDKLSENDFVKTESKSSIELQLADNSMIKIKENSILKISKLINENESQKVNLFLKDGKALFKPSPQTQGSSFEVRTETITSGVRGTEFVLTRDSKESKIANWIKNSILMNLKI